MNKEDKRKLCSGCYNEEYWYGLGGAKECWYFKSSKIVKRLLIHVDQRPPYDKKATFKTLDCKKKKRYCYVSTDSLDSKGFWKS